jgi:Na+/H+ antiporter NhaD/arsenite permease-like protein
MEVILTFVVPVLFVGAAVKTEVVEIALEEHLPVLAAVMAALVVLALVVRVAAVAAREDMRVLAAQEPLPLVSRVLRALVVVAAVVVVGAEAVPRELLDKAVTVLEDQALFSAVVQALALPLRVAEQEAETSLAVLRVVLAALLVRCASSGPALLAHSPQQIPEICNA